MTQTQETPPDVDNTTITPELIAKTIATISQIGYAQRVLQTAGYTTKIVANRITVDGVIEAQLISTNGHGWWQVYRVDGRPPVWTVGAFDETTSDWSGAE